MKRITFTERASRASSFALLAFLLLVAGLGTISAQDETPEATSDMASEGTPVEGGTLRAAWDAEWVSLDPHLTSAYSSFAVLANVVEGLTAMDDNVQLSPALAESWEQSEDRLTWTFHLREGVTFSNGDPFTAADALFSFERIADPELGSGRVSNCGGEGATFEAVDDYTFTITTVEPDGILPINVADAAGCAIISPASVGEDGQVVTPIGTGPFIIEEVSGTTNMTLLKNENYWQEGLPYLDSIEIIVMPEASVREAALLGGQVDWIMSPAPQSVETLESTEGIVVSGAPQLQYHYMGINLTREPFDDVRVRQAIAYAIDRQQVCEAGEFGLCTPIEGPTAPGSPWYFDYAPYGRDVERARQLLAEAGVENLELELMPTSTYENSVRQAQVIQQNLADVGITATINAPEWAQWLELEGSGQFDIYILSWIGLTDADNYYYLQHRTGEVFNFTGYSNPEFDELVEEGRSMSDFDARYPIYEQANQILVDDAPYVYLYSPLAFRAHTTAVHGYVTRSDLLNKLWTTWIDSGE
jgi:peptide/nickel transport system substrate-binding protein